MKCFFYHFQVEVSASQGRVQADSSQGEQQERSRNSSRMWSFGSCSQVTRPGWTVLTTSRGRFWRFSSASASAPTSASARSQVCEADHWAGLPSPAAAAYELSAAEHKRLMAALKTSHKSVGLYWRAPPHPPFAENISRIWGLSPRFWTRFTIFTNFM